MFTMVQLLQGSRVKWIIYLKEINYAQKNQSELSFLLVLFLQSTQEMS